MRDARAERPHAVRNDVHSAPAHAAIVQLGERRFHLIGIDPVVVGACIVLEVRHHHPPLCQPGKAGVVKCLTGELRRLPAHVKAIDYQGIQRCHRFLDVDGPVEAQHAKAAAVIRNGELLSEGDYIGAELYRCEMGRR